MAAAYLALAVHLEERAAARAAVLEARADFDTLLFGVGQIVGFAQMRRATINMMSDGDAAVALGRLSSSVLENLYAISADGLIGFRDLIQRELWSDEWQWNDVRGRMARWRR